MPDEKPKMHVSRMNPNDVLVVDGPAIIHVNVEKGCIVCATNAPDSTGIAHVKGRDFNGLKKLHGDDAAAMVEQVKNVD